MAIEIECVGPCAPNEGTTLPDNQMPFLVPPGSGGGGGNFVLNVVDTDSVDLSGSGTQMDPLQATVKVSAAQPANMVQIVADGLYVPHEIPANGTTGQVLAKKSATSYDLEWVDQSGGGAPVVVADSSTVDLGGNGSGPTPIIAAVKISANVGNGLSAQADGLFVTAGAKGDRGDSVVPNEWGILTDARVTAIQAAGVDWVFSVIADNGATQGDQRSNQAIPAGISGDMASHLVRYDASDNIWQDLGPFAGVQGPAGPGFAPGGTIGQVLVKASGTDYDTQWQDPPGASITTADSDSIDVGGSGAPLSPLTMVVKKDPVAGNMLSISPAGVLVPHEIPTGGTAGQVLKKVNATDWNVAWANEVTGIASVTTSNSQRITFSGAGTAGSPLTADVVVPTDTDQLLVSGASGLKVSSLQSIVGKANTAQTAVLGDTGKYIRFTNSSAKGFTIPLNSAVAFQVGASMTVFNVGAGDLTLSATAGVTLNKSPAQTLVIKQGKAASLTKVAADEWDLVGGMEFV